MWHIVGTIPQEREMKHEEAMGNISVTLRTY